MDEHPPTRLYARDKLWVWATLCASGDLRIAGQDLGVGRFMPGTTELEYAFTVVARDVPQVVAALRHDAAARLGGPSLADRDDEGGDDVLALLAAHGEALVTEGESRWLGRHGIEFEYWQWAC